MPPSPDWDRMAFLEFLTVLAWLLTMIVGGVYYALSV